MGWVRRIEPLILSQESDIPYVIKQNGVLLCFDNMYRNGRGTNDDFFITFKASRQSMMRQSTNYHRFYDFPVQIPFEDIICLNETVIDGKLVKLACEKRSESVNTAIIKESYITKLCDDGLQELAETLEGFNKSFILVGDDIDTNSRLLSDYADTIHHVDWGRTCVTIADRLCESSSRKYCWTKAVPIVEVTTYGLKPDKDTEKLYKVFSDLDIEVTTHWGG